MLQAYKTCPLLLLQACKFVAYVTAGSYFSGLQKSKGCGFLFATAKQSQNYKTKTFLFFTIDFLKRVNLSIATEPRGKKNFRFVVGLDILNNLAFIIQDIFCRFKFLTKS